MSNVYSLERARERRALALDPRPVPADTSDAGARLRQAFDLDTQADGFDVAFDDVLRQTTGEPDSHDLVFLGPIANQQIRQLFWAYGLRRMPVTWAELTGNLQYCYLLSVWVKRFETSQPAPLRDRALARHNAQQSGRGTMLQHLAQGRLDLVWRWHEEHQVFRANSLDPQLVQP